MQQLSQSANPAQVQALDKFSQLHTGAYTYQLQPSPVLEVLTEAVDAGILQGIKRLPLVQRRPAMKFVRGEVSLPQGRWDQAITAQIKPLVSAHLWVQTALQKHLQ